jgi:hypothetical protein
MTDWPEYESHKVVRAAVIVSIAHPGPYGKRIIMVRPEEGEPAVAFEPNLTNMPANVGDYAMLYPDGYKSISPRKAFNEGYTRRAMSAAQLGAAVRGLGLTGK